MVTSTARVLSESQAVIVKRVGDGLEVRLTVNISTVETAALRSWTTGGHADCVAARGVCTSRATLCCAHGRGPES